MRLLAFIIVSIVLSPLLIIGLAIYMFRVLAVLVPKGIDGTTYEPYTARLFMHDLGTRSDPVASQLAPHLTVTAAPLWPLLSVPFRWASRLTGYVPTVFSFPPERPLNVRSIMTFRTEFFDRTLNDASDHVQQVVVLGAGWDTRAYDEGLSDLKFFEVDGLSTQQEKCKALANAGVDASHVTFVPVDFNEASWLDAVSTAGFDPTLPTYVLWEGVSMYLDEAAVHDTLRTIAGFGPGSVIAFDYLPKELFTSRGLYGLVGKYIKFGIQLIYRTEFKALFPGGSHARGEIERILAHHRLALVDHEVLAYREKYPMYGFVLAKIQ